MPNKRPFIPTNHQVKRSMKRSTGIEKPNLASQLSLGIGMKISAPVSTRPAEVVKVNLSSVLQQSAKDIVQWGVSQSNWLVKFLDSGTDEWVAPSSDYGFSWLPEGDIKKNILYPTERTFVEIGSDIYGSPKIVSTQLPQTQAIPSASQIARGNSQIIVHSDYIEINSPKIVINGVTLQL